MYNLVKTDVEQLTKPVTNRTAEEWLKVKITVQNIINGLEKIGKKVKPSKDGKKIIKLMKDFIKCNITSPAIERKYLIVVGLLSKYYKGS